MESIIQDLNKFGEEEICTELIFKVFPHEQRKKNAKLCFQK